jgi:outer membrane protein assembly factor BamB
MTNNRISEPTGRKPLRLWPGVVGVALQLLGWFVVPAVTPEAGTYGFMGGVFGGALVIVVWWLFFSRAPWLERVGAIALMPVAVVATKRVVHESISNGMMGMMLPIYSIPALSLALVAWAAASHRLSTGLRRASMVAAILLACGAFTLLRTEGVRGEGGSDLHWRWTPTPEERLLAQAGSQAASPRSGPVAVATSTPEASLPPAPAEPLSPRTAPSAAKPPAKQALTLAGAEPETAVAGATTPAAAPLAPPHAEWPGFRGPDRDGIVRGVRIETDWAKSPPAELWRRPIGPGWSSFAVQGDLLYTQEQRGEDEDVSCYHLATGKLVWRHRDAARFWESNAGPGPRATPTVSNGRVYTFGATGILNALDADDGSVAWSRNVAADTGAKTPGWGFSSSPLVTGDLVIVAASGRLAAYDVATGNPRWVQDRGGSYSSPHLMTIGGVTQLLLLSSTGATSVAPADGTLLWEHAWEGVPILQPARIPEGDLLITTGGMGGEGTRRITVAQGPGGWTASERWTSRGLKPYFNDIVVHEGHAYGFDGSILACIDLADGKRKWKGGRYGNGQLVLLPDQDLLLVLSEEGELALVRATADQFTEIARAPAIEGKTWNHPALVDDLLLVRNGEEMAAFRLARAGG